MKDIVIPTLEADDIEVKIKQVTQKGAFALLYKTARTDMRYLDEVFGMNNWQVEYERIGDVLYCTISIWDDEKKQWIKKQNCGIESREDGEGNEVKGEASDAMKRSGFLLSIGRELYSSPKIFLNIPTKQDGEYKGKPIYKLEDPWAKYIVTDIGYDTKRRINKLIIANEKTMEVVYRYGGSANSNNKQAQKPTTKPQEKPKAQNKQPEEDKSALQKKVDAVVETSDTIPQDDKDAYLLVIKEFNKKHNLNKEKFCELYNKAVEDKKIEHTKPLNKFSPDEWIFLIATMQNLFDDGFFEGVA